MLSLLQLSDRLSCHIWLVRRIKFAHLEANLSWDRDILVNPIRLLSLSLGEEPRHDLNIVDFDVKP